MPPEAHVDLARLDFDHVVADKESVRAANPQRFEMEQLDAIVLVDMDQKLIVGYKDVRADEFWVRGHMPDYPLFPGVLMCEAAAQLCSYFVVSQGGLRGDFLGFGGLDNVRFRSAVHIGDRLVVVAKTTKFHTRQMIFSVQGFVGTRMVFNADVVGVPLRRKAAEVQEA